MRSCRALAQWENTYPRSQTIVSSEIRLNAGRMPVDGWVPVLVEVSELGADFPPISYASSDWYMTPGFLEAAQQPQGAIASGLMSLMAAY